MLGELRFRCERIPGTRRRLERQLRPPHKPSLLLPLLVLGVVGAVASSNRDLASTARAAMVFGTEVVGDRVLVLVDDSGSMSGTDDAVQAQLTRLRAAGIELSHRTTIPGFALSVTDSYAVAPALIQGMAADRAIDMVYVLSDFSAGDDQANDSASIALVARLLRERRARIYWVSVRDVPAPVYYDVARESGGAVILTR